MRFMSFMSFMGFMSFMSFLTTVIVCSNRIQNRSFAHLFSARATTRKSPVAIATASSDPGRSIVCRLLATTTGASSR